MPGRGRRFPEALKNVHQKACDTPSCASRPFANAVSCRNFPSVSQTAEVLRGFLQKELVPRGGDQGREIYMGERGGAALKQEAKKLAARPSEVRPRKDHRGVDLISDALPFGRLWYGEPKAISNAIGYAKHRSRSQRCDSRLRMQRAM
jgi:hypothetical protein